VALKVLPGTFALDPKRVERFRREARATARIHHPSIVPVYEVGEAEGNHFYAMELIDGASLDRVLAEEREAAAKRGRLSRPSAVSPSASDPAAIARRVEHIALLCEGLAAAHALGLVHRDVKPSNVLIDRSGRWVLVDFGLVHEAEVQTLTRSGEMVGTLAYMSPEQASRREADVRSDVYALGVVLYEALTLRAPFDGKSESEIQSAILFEDPPAPRKLNPRVHRDLETVILHAMEKRPERRYASAADLAADLRRFLRYEPIHARPQTRATRFLRRAARHRVRIAGSAAFIVLLSLSGWLWWTSQRPPRYALTPPRQVTFDLTALTTEPCFSPDGKFLSYASDRGGDNLQIWVQSIEGGEARQITFHEADDREPDFSPDGKTIAYRSERDGGGIYLIPASGGAERKLADKGRRPRFSPDGTLVTYWAGEDPQAGQLFIVSSSGGAATRLESVRRICR
jgi:serine/threonine protein kinase